MKEEAVVFGPSKSLIGVISEPDEHSEERTGILLLNSGIVHRVGANRLYVKIARSVATLGFTSIRFDFSGVGDSGIRHDLLPRLESKISETQDAMNVLASTRGINRFILMGICSGAVDSYRTALVDTRVVGMMLINQGGWTSEYQHAMNGLWARRYLMTRLFNPKNWFETIIGRAHYDWMVFGLQRLFNAGSKVRSVLNNIRSNFKSMSDRGVGVLFICSETDQALYTYKSIFDRRPAELNSPEVQIIQGADHIFTPLHTQESLIEVIKNQLQKWQGLESGGQSPCSQYLANRGFSKVADPTFQQ